jgi:hypothetical protein
MLEPSSQLAKQKKDESDNHHVTPFSAVSPYQITPTYFLQEVCPSRNSETVVLSYSTSVVTDSLPSAGHYIYPMRSPAQTIGSNCRRPASTRRPQRTVIFPYSSSSDSIFPYSSSSDKSAPHTSHQIHESPLDDNHAQLRQSLPII